MKPSRLLERITQGAVRNIGFHDTQQLVEAFGFTLVRIDGSHYIYVRPDVPELVNLQAYRGEAKPYQIRQFLRLVEKYGLKLGQ